jgi:dTDP-glucose pyrophosphorylase
LKKWQELLITPLASVREALQCIDKGGAQMVLVVDESRRLLGTLSDGDVRRGLLAGYTLDSKVTDVMHRTPMVARADDPRRSIFAKIRRYGLHQLPVVDSDRRVVGMETIEDLVIPEERDNLVVIMAGGLGSRLKELTQSVPKPMLKVHNRPILEILVETFVEQGFHRFQIAVNYKAEMIEAHFGDGRRFDAQIEYLRESKRMGTAGALSLLPEKPRGPFLVANADLMAKVDYVEMLSAHDESQAIATMAVREYEFQIPYGVIAETDGQIQGIAEKPIHRSLVCAGIYVLSPEVLALLSKDAYCDMPSVFEQIIKGGRKAISYPVRGYWLDVGRLADFHKANEDFPEVFS